MLNNLAALLGTSGGGANSFESIATATGTGSSGTITFSSIPATYKHLVIRGFARSTGSSGGAGVDVSVNLNSDTAGNYTYHQLTGDGTTAAAAGSGFGNGAIYVRNASVDSTTAANIFGVCNIDIMDYTSSKLKTVRVMSGSNANTTTTSYKVSLSSGLWNNTASISTITLTEGTGTNFSTGTIFALYGIKG